MHRGSAQLRKAFPVIGDFGHHPFAGSFWFRRRDHKGSRPGTSAGAAPAS
jgi:hypothetical protein